MATAKKNQEAYEESGDNAVPVSAPRTTKEGLVIPDGYEESDLIPGTNVPQTAAPKAGDYTR